MTFLFYSVLMMETILMASLTPTLSHQFYFKLHENILGANFSYIFMKRNDHKKRIFPIRREQFWCFVCFLPFGTSAVSSVLRKWFKKMIALFYYIHKALYSNMKIMKLYPVNYFDTINITKYIHYINLWPFLKMTKWRILNSIGITGLLA